MEKTRKQMFLEFYRARVSALAGTEEQYATAVIDKVLPMSTKQFDLHEKEVKRIISRCGRDIPRLTRELRALHAR